MKKTVYLCLLCLGIPLSVCANSKSFDVQDLQIDSITTQRNSIGMTLVEIPAGYFYMGSHGKGIHGDEAPIHKVTISNTFLLGATEVTNAQYELFDREHKKLRSKSGLSKEDDEAVIFVDYNDATAFCKWLSKKEGKPYRLPTEAEWEYAARAGTFLNFSMNNGLPEAYQKNQKTMWGIDSTVTLNVRSTPINQFGLYEMHGNVEEWCYDWYGPYEAEAQTDPIGRIDGDFRVTRGGSHSTLTEFLLSANRMAMMPEDKHWLTGFRVVQAEMPKTEALRISEKPLCMQEVSQTEYASKKPVSEAFFKDPIVYVKEPECNNDVPFYAHNHVPAIIDCENGDLLAIWFTTNDEAGREMTILGSRLRAGNSEWDAPSEFFRVPDRNLTGSSLFRDLNGTLIHTNGVETAGSWQNLAMVMRSSADNGATWTKPRFINDDHDTRNQVISGMIRTEEGWLVQPADATPWGDGGSAVHISKDGGKTFKDFGKGVPNNFVDGGTGGTIAGIHAGVVQLKNGDLMALARGDDITDKSDLERMPKSISKDGGKTWSYQPSEFAPIDGGQRLVLRRLHEGPLLLVSFTNHPYRIRNVQNGMTFSDGGNEFKGYGMFAAISFDEGKTWPVKKLLTEGGPRLLDGGAWTGFFEMNATHAEPAGYLAATQSVDKTIHLISSRLHYRFNLKWLLDGTQYNKIDY